MESKLNSDEIVELQERLNFLKKSFWKRLAFQLILIFGGLTAGIYLNHGGLFFGSLLALIVSIYINYQITWKWVAQLNSDINGGIKQKTEITISKVNKKHSFKEFILSNGIEISELELDAYDISASELQANDKLIVEFSPRKKYVFNAIKTDS